MLCCLFSQSRLRKQDVGLKTHLQQLDQQISELKLDVSKASSERLESDSRPSSGVTSHTPHVSEQTSHSPQSEESPPPAPS